jgi:hypothetical protein
MKQPIGIAVVVTDRANREAKNWHILAAEVHIIFRPAYEKSTNNSYHVDQRDLKKRKDRDNPNVSTERHLAADNLVD